MIKKIIEYLKRPKWKIRKLINRFIDLNKKREILEGDGCMKRSCSSCSLLTRVNEYYSTCPHEKYGKEMLDIYKKLFPNEPLLAYTWNQKVERVKNLIV